jgi:hypothetical protein
MLFLVCTEKSLLPVLFYFFALFQMDYQKKWLHQSCRGNASVEELQEWASSLEAAREVARQARHISWLAAQKFKRAAVLAAWKAATEERQQERKRTQKLARKRAQKEMAQRNALKTRIMEGRFSENRAKRLAMDSAVLRVASSRMSSVVNENAVD